MVSLAGEYFCSVSGARGLRERERGVVVMGKHDGRYH